MVIVRKDGDETWYEITGPLAHHPKTGNKTKMKEENITKFLEGLLGQTLDLANIYARRAK